MSAFRRALALASACCLVPLVARADDPYADFRVPEHRSSSWLVQASGGTGALRYGLPGYLAHVTSAQGSLLTARAWSLESEAQRRDLAAVARATWNYNRSRAESGPALDQVERQRINGQLARLSGLQRSYLGGTEFAVDITASALLDLQQSDDSRTQHGVSGPNESFSGDETRRDFYRHIGDVTVGIGHGRVRDVTGVFAAQLIEQRLLATGSLTRPLSPATRLRLAQLHYAAGDFGVAHDRPARYFWREVERALREDGALGGSSLDAYSQLRVLEPAMGGLLFTRWRGGFVRPFFFGSETRGHRDEDFRSSSLALQNGIPVFSSSFGSSSRTRLDQEDSGAGLGAEYHRPVGMRWQSDVSAVARYGGGPRRNLDFGAAAQVQYLLADRWYTSALLQQSVHSQRVGDARSEPGWVVQGVTRLSYLVEDSWSLDLQASAYQTQFRDSNGPFLYTRFESRSSLSFGLSYRPLGRFDAPGLGLSERLSTPGL